MRKIVPALLLAILVFCTPHLLAQDKVAEEKTPAITPLRVQVVFSEYEGEKKISNLPYTLLVNADDKGPQASVRMGLRVPIVTSGSTSPSVSKQFTYMDVGTNMDGRADRIDGGRFLLKINIEKSSLYSPGEVQKSASLEGNEVPGGQPVVQQFRSQVNLLIRDGQTIQSTVATDPISGHVLKVDITLNVIK
jgi:Bacterial type II and III secretion system protein